MEAENECSPKGTRSLLPIPRNLKAVARAMFQNWRFKLRKAEEALRAGRLDEASELLIRGDLTDYLPGKRLAGKLAASLGERAQQYSQGADWQAAWSDLLTAIRFGGETSELVGIRQQLIDAGFAAVHQQPRSGGTQSPRWGCWTASNAGEPPGRRWTSSVGSPGKSNRRTS